jgi:hypothetical protein
MLFWSEDEHGDDLDEKVESTGLEGLQMLLHRARISPRLSNDIM